jgi:hypothetical protein
LQFERIAFMEHLAVRSDLGLTEACERLVHGLGLPPFDFDSENATEWGQVEVDGVEGNVSSPYEAGTLREWNDTTPTGCNVGVLLIVSKGHPAYPYHDRAVQGLVPSYGQRMADTMATDVYHHCLWLGLAQTLRQAAVFRPRTPGG